MVRGEVLPKFYSASNMYITHDIPLQIYLTSQRNQLRSYPTQMGKQELYGFSVSLILDAIFAFSNSLSKIHLLPLYIFIDMLGNWIKPASQSQYYFLLISPHLPQLHVILPKLLEQRLYVIMKIMSRRCCIGTIGEQSGQKIIFRLY